MSDTITTVSGIYSLIDRKRSRSYAFNVREKVPGVSDNITRKRFSTLEEAEAERDKYLPPTCAETVSQIPLHETIKAVLDVFENTGIPSEHLAGQIEMEVQAWIKLNLERERIRMRDAWIEFIRLTRDDALTGVLLWMLVATVYAIGGEALKAIA